MPLEWQVTEEEPMLFATARAPQHPVKCVLPSPESKESRRLGETKARGKAEQACAHHSGKVFENCVVDVMAVGDVAIAMGF